MKIKNLIMAVALAASTVGVFASPNLPAVPQSNLTPSHLVGPGLTGGALMHMEICEPLRSHPSVIKCYRDVKVDEVNFNTDGILFTNLGTAEHQSFTDDGKVSVKFSHMHKVNICGVPNTDTCMKLSNITGFVDSKTDIIQILSDSTVVKTIDADDYDTIALLALDGGLKHERHHYQIK